MAAHIISISSDSYKKSVGSHVPRVILFGAIPAIILVILEVPVEVPISLAGPLVSPKVGAVSVISPTGVLDLVDYSSSSDSDPSEDSLPPVPELPLVSPFLYSDDSEADSESEPAEQRPESHESLAVHDAMVSRWRDMVASRPSSPSESLSHDTFAPSSEFPLALIVAPPGIHSSSSGSSLDSLSDSPLVHSSGCDTSCQAHSRPSNRVASSRLVYPPVMTPRHSEAFRRWRSTPLSTPYPPTTSESFLDSSFKRSFDSSLHSARPSRKRYRSPITIVQSSTPVLRSIAPTHADLLPPRKRFRDSYSPEDIIEEHMEIGTADAETVADLSIGDRVGAHIKDGIGMGIEVIASDIREDEEDFEAETSAGGMVEIKVDPRVELIIDEDVPDHDVDEGAVEITYETLGDLVQRQLEVDLLIAGGERASLSDEIRRTMTNTHSGMTPAAIEEMINRGNGNGNHHGNDIGDRPVVRECTYQDFIKCQLLNFKGTKRVVGLIRWFEKMETVFQINNCTEKYQVKYAICTLINSALTWWNSHKRIIGTNVAYAMSWRELMKLMVKVYCSRNEIQKMESKLWNLTMKNNVLAAYTQKF
nr:reverse transcriptase domain-containing protein [Tanacetum cinerariifolium]